MPITEKKMSEDLHLIEKTYNHTGNQKKGQISDLLDIGQFPCFDFGLSTKFISILSHIFYVCMALIVSFN